jgi:hypothetical protein
MAFSSTLSQEYFDETVLENEDVFDLSPDEALTETIDQLFKQSAQQAKFDLDGWTDLQREAGLSLTHPQSKQGLVDRQQIAEFLNLLQQDEWTAEIVDNIWDFLQQGNRGTTDDNMKKDEKPLFVGHLFWQQGKGGDEIQSEVSSKNVLGKLTAYAERNDIAFEKALRVCLAAIQVGPESDQRSRQEQILHEFVVPSQGWSRLFGSESTDTVGNRLLWLQLIYQICRGHEPNKKQCNSKPILQVLMESLQKCAEETAEDQSSHPDVSSLAEAACRVVTVLCRFDDFSQHATDGQATDSTGMVVSSAHSTVTTLGNMGVVNTLNTLLQGKAQNSQQLLLATLQTLRSLAIQDEMVQRMVGAGLLDGLQSAFQHYCERVMDKNSKEKETAAHNDKANDCNSTGDEDENLRLAIVTALIGLYRNMSANDELKTTLCRSSQHSIVGPLIATLQSIDNSSKVTAITKLQEHVCATLGSMALRQPQNAELIVEDYQGHLVVLKAMQQSNSPLVQRQGALALRNLASRASDAVKQALLDAGSEAVLRHAATLGAVDEAYAALRDLGCHAELLQANPETGKLQRQQMFGEVPLKFRPVYD